MVALFTQKELRAVQKLPFCYFCGKSFEPGDEKTLDHLPPETVFDKRDRIPLQLPAHRTCNLMHSDADEKFGQLVGLKRGYAPSNPKNRRLQIAVFPEDQIAAIANLEIKQQVWRWIRGFHAALYQEFCPEQTRFALETPFPSARVDGREAFYEPLKPQHALFVERIKVNRLKGTLDRIRCNNGKLIYECVWFQVDDSGPWSCFFALDVDGWKELGDKRRFKQRGCAGLYTPPSGAIPQNATRGQESAVIIPNADPLDAFAK